MPQEAVDIAGTGFAVLDRLYADDEKPVEALGGSCGNVLVSLAMLDHKVVPVLALGHDDVGEALVDEFTRAGADTDFIFRRRGIASPVLAQRLETASAQHWFSFICPETEEELPRYQPIAEAEVNSARQVLDACSVFYADRLSDSILSAMETAERAGAIIYFEPSSIDDEALFEHALRLVKILKFSSDRISDYVAKHAVDAKTISIVTHGVAGLEVRQGTRSVTCSAVFAPIVRDTCGSGDMVSVGVIDWILNRKQSNLTDCAMDDLLGGVVAGQRLAAANCAFPGARGLFHRHGANFARLVLNDGIGDALSQLDLFDDGSRQ
jgi:fructokinase